MFSLLLLCVCEREIEKENERNTYGDVPYSTKCPTDFHRTTYGVKYYSMGLFFYSLACALCNHLHLCSVDVNCYHLAWVLFYSHFAYVQITAQFARWWKISQR